VRNLVTGAIVAGLIVISGCVKIPPHNFQAPPPAVAAPPPAPSSATVQLEAIDSEPISGALISALPGSIDADRVPGGCMNPCYHFKLKAFDAVLSNGKLVASPKYSGNVQAKEDVVRRLIPVACDLDPVNVDVVVTATPVLLRKDAKWVLSLANVSLTPSIGSGSDTHCVIGGLVDASGKLQDKLNEVANSMKSKKGSGDLSS